jgi:5-methylcytosine-specific restriction enzyme subunit McrC
MALLYEHYVYSLLHKAYGSAVKYQYSGWFRWKPDFLHIGEKLIMDTKYMPDLDYSGPSGDVVAQLSGYSRVESFTEALGVDADTVVPCLIIYPYLSDVAMGYHFNTEKKLLDQATPLEHLIKFYKIGVPMPKL